MKFTTRPRIFNTVPILSARGPGGMLLPNPLEDSGWQTFSWQQPCKTPKVNIKHHLTGQANAQMPQVSPKHDTKQRALRSATLAAEMALWNAFPPFERQPQVSRPTMSPWRGLVSKACQLLQAG